MTLCTVVYTRLISRLDMWGDQSNDTKSNASHKQPINLNSINPIYIPINTGKDGSNSTRRQGEPTRTHPKSENRWTTHRSRMGTSQDENR